MAYFDGPACLIVHCTICNKIINKSLRGRKNTCSDECHKLKVQNIDRKSYVNQMAKNPNFAQEQSAKQYARIKADPEKMEARRIAQNERMQLPNYKESARKSQEKYRSQDLIKEKIASRMRKYRYENPELIAKIEAKHSEKRSLERERLRVEEPEKFEALQSRERLENRQRKAEKRLAEFQKDIQKMVSKDE